MKADAVTIQNLHRTYCRLSRMDVGLRFNRESSWVEFVRSGFTEADLEAVLKRLLRLVESGERRPECLKFSNVIEGLDRFEEELAMIRAEHGALTVGEARLSVWELEKILEKKVEIARRLFDRYTTEDAFGATWTAHHARDEFLKLTKEIRALKSRIAALA